MSLLHVLKKNNYLTFLRKVYTSCLSGDKVIIMKRKALFCAALTALSLCLPFSVSGAPYSSPLSAGDGYSIYQWGLYNDGSLVIDTESISTEAYMELYQSFIDWVDSGGIGLPPRRIDPSDIIHTRLESVPGIDMNVLKGKELYEAQKASNEAALRDVTVALIDTGVDTGHAELVDALWVNQDEIPGDGIDNDLNGYIDDINGYNFYDHSNVLRINKIADIHGTHGAGTIGAKSSNGGMVGITDNSHVKIMVLKALGNDGGGTEESIIEAIRYAEANGADICNLSLGGTRPFPSLEQVIAASDMLFVISSGNGDENGRGYDIDASPVYPASYGSDNVISVANLSMDGNLDQSSNYGAVSVDIAAPGTYILSTVPGNRFDFLTGTSMAAPMVTGVCAMVYSYRQDYSLDEVRIAVLASARKLDSLNGRVATGGIPDMYAAMTFGWQ